MVVPNVTRFFLTLFLMGLLFVFNGPWLLAQNKVRLVLATATTGGTYYPVGVGIATLITNTLEPSENISMTAVTSAGSGENIQLLMNREADLAILQSLYGTMAWQGRGRYRESPQTFIRTVTRLWENVEHIAVLRKYAITQAFAALGSEDLELLEFTEEQCRAVNSTYPASLFSPWLLYITENKENE